MPKRVRFFLARDAEVASRVLEVFVRAVFAHLRRDARRRGVRGGRPGSVETTRVLHVFADGVERSEQ